MMIVVNEDLQAEAVRLLRKLGQLFGVRVHEANADIGKRWEREVAARLKRLFPGKVSYKQDGHEMQDVLVFGYGVQCKHREPSSSGKFCISFTARANEYTKSDIRFFACRYGQAEYIVPFDAMCDSNGKLRKSIPVKSLAKYRDRWDLITPEASGCCQCDSQATLPGFEE